ncbi:hypothetical protein HKX48_009228 [Thoreauomyces humboldtii]|nr:hypothetical protein HKX48_009228 [Thoreauomyces humboldtii]
MIFNHITDQPTLYSIAMVCRAFNICVTPILYAAPRFSGTFSWAEFTVTMMRRPADSRKLSAFVQMVDLAGTEPPPELTRESANAVSRPSRVVPTLLANNISLRLHTDPPPSTTPAEGLHGTTAGMATDEMGDLEIGTQSLFTAYENSYMMNGTASGSNPLAAHHATHAPPGFPTMPPGNASTGEPNAHGAWLQRATANAVVAAALMTPPPQNANMSISLAQIRQIVQASIAEHATPHPPPQHRTTTVIPVATAAQTVNIASNNGPTTSTSKKNRPPRLNLLVSALTTLSRFENLRHLSLRHSTLGRDLLIVETGDYESFQTDVPAFLNSKRLCPHEELVRLATRCPNLVSLDLGHCEWVTNALVADLVEEARALRHLNLEKCSKIAVPAAMLWFLNPIQVVSANLGTFSSGSTTHLGTTAVTSTDLGTDQGTSGGGSDRPSHSDIEPSTAVKDRRTRNNLGKSMKDLVLPHLKVG